VPWCLVKVDRRLRDAFYLHYQGYDGGSAHIWNVGLLQQDYKTLHRRQLSFYDINFVDGKAVGRRRVRPMQKKVLHTFVEKCTRSRWKKIGIEEEIRMHLANSLNYRSRKAGEWERQRENRMEHGILSSLSVRLITQTPQRDASNLEGGGRVAILSHHWHNDPGNVNFPINHYSLIDFSLLLTEASI
jgi:hypothetical protein